jgi:hypothetical protein
VSSVVASVNFGCGGCCEPPVPFHMFIVVKLA